MLLLFFWQMESTPVHFVALDLNPGLRYRYIDRQIPNWQEADQLAIYKAQPRISTQEYWETNAGGGRVEALNSWPPDYNTSALTHPATLPQAQIIAERDKH